MSLISRSDPCSLPIRPARLLSNAREWFASALRRRLARRELARLDDHLLRDIGLTRYDIGGPGRKPNFEDR